MAASTVVVRESGLAAAREAGSAPGTVAGTTSGTAAAWGAGKSPVLTPARPVSTSQDKLVWGHQGVDR
jgi:hypothetical protein